MSFYRGIAPRLVLINGMDSFIATISSTTINAIGDGIASAFQAPESFTLSEVGFYIASVTGSPGNLRVSVQGADSSANGEPDGTVAGGGSPASVTFATPSAGWNRVTLDNAHAVTRGDILSVAVESISGTWDGSNFVSLSHGAGPTHESGFGRSYSKPSTSWVRNNQLSVISAGNGTLDYVGHGVYDINTADYPVDGNGSFEEVGLKFTVPDDGVSYTLEGVGFFYSTTAAAGYTHNLYSGGAAGDTTPAISQAYDEQLGSEGTQLHTTWLDTAQALTNGATYRVALRQTSTTATSQFYTYTLGDNDARLGESNGWDMSLSHRTSGNWTDVALEIPVCWLWMTAEAAGGGGSGAAYKRRPFLIG